MSAKQNKIKYQTGDIFSFEIKPGEYGFGRVILDIPLLKEKKLIKSTSFLDFGNNDTLFIELYSNTSNRKTIDVDLLKTIISGLFTSNVDILLGYWQIFDNVKVDPTKIKFPEFLSHNGAFHGNYIIGELNETIEFPYEKIQELGFKRKEFATIEIPQVVLHTLGRIGEINGTQKLIDMRDISKADLFYSEAKETIYGLLPTEFKKTYYELSKERGFDLKRFF